MRLDHLLSMENDLSERGQDDIRGRRRIEALGKANTLFNFEGPKGSSAVEKKRTTGVRQDVGV